MQNETGAPERGPRFVWHSTNASVRDSIPSVLAALEVGFAVTAYWFVAIYFGSLTHLWISISVAPLLLLRSENSVALGLKWFDSYLSSSHNASTWSRLSVRQKFTFSIFVLLAAASLFAVLLSSNYWATDKVGWIFLKTATILFLAIQITAATLSAAGLYGPIFEAAENILGTLGISLVFIGIFTGIWIRSLAIRLTATAFFLGQGLLAIPRNFNENLFVIDFFHHAELIPGYEEAHGIDNQKIITTSSAFVKYFRTADKIEKILTPVAFAILFLPAYFYRLSIKSTCWLYFPLVYIVAKRDRPQQIPKILYQLDEVLFLLETRKEWWRRFLALITLVGLFCTTILFNVQNIGKIISSKFISPLEYFFLIDLTKLAPWQIFNIASASITVYLFFKVDDIRFRKRKPKGKEADARFARRINNLLLLRNWSTTILICFALFHAILILSPIAKWLPDSVLQAMRLIFSTHMSIP